MPRLDPQMKADVERIIADKAAVAAALGLSATGRPALDLDAIRSRAERARGALGWLDSPADRADEPGLETQAHDVIAASILDVPDLIAEVERLRRVNGEWGAIHARMVDGLAERGVTVRIGRTYTGAALAEIDRLRATTPATVDAGPGPAGPTTTATGASAPAAKSRTGASSQPTGVRA